MTIDRIFMTEMNPFDPESALTTPKFFEDGRCVGEDPTLWDGDDKGKTFQALRMCADCPVVQSCLDWAVHHEEFGVFGAKTAAARVRLRRKLGIKLESPELKNLEEEKLADICGSMPLKELALKWNVTTRTAARWRAKNDENAA